MEILSIEVGPEKLSTYITSLESATVYEIEPRCRPSKSGATLWCDGFRAVLRTNKHEHELDCSIVVNEVYGKAVFCSWKVDGKEVGTILFRPDEPLIERIKTIIETVSRVGQVGEEILPEVPKRIVLEPKKYVAWVPKISTTVPAPP